MQCDSYTKENFSYTRTYACEMRISLYIRWDFGF